MISTILRFIRNDKGATAIEYGLIAALVAVVIVGGLTLVGDNLLASFNFIGGEVEAPAAGG